MKTKMDYRDIRGLLKRKAAEAIQFLGIGRYYGPDDYEVYPFDTLAEAKAYARGVHTGMAAAKEGLTTLPDPGFLGVDKDGKRFIPHERWTDL